MQITYFFRKPYDFHFSIENVFNGIVSNLPDHVQYRIYELPYYSKGVHPRIQGARAAGKNQGQVNHITGDVHYIALGLQKENTILTMHDLGFMKHTNPVARFFLWLFWIWLPVRRVKYITTISEATKKDILRYVRCKPGKIRIIPDFIHPDFQPVQRLFKKEKPVILHVGTKFNKNLERTISALSGIPCTLKIIGRLTESQIDRLHASKINYINQFDLSDEELRQAYINCDMLVFCSTLEGFGLPILEAQATGRPVVTSNISSMPEVAGNAACFADPYDVNSIRQSILKVISNENYRSQLINKGFENVKRFDIKTVTNMYVDLYSEVLKTL